MKDLNTFTASIYAKAEQKKKQTKQTALALTAAAFALATAVTAAAVRPPRAMQSVPSAQTEQTGTVPQGADGAAVESYTAPADATFPAAAYASKPQSTTAAEQTIAIAEADAAPSSTAPASAKAQPASDEVGMTEIGMTEIALERRTEPYLDSDSAGATHNMLGRPTQTYSTAEIIDRALAALPADPASQEEPMVLTVHDAKTNSDQYEVWFPGDGVWTVVRLNAALGLVDIRERPRSGADVSGAYNPSN